MKTASLVAAVLMLHVGFGQDSLKTVQLEEVAIMAVRASEAAPVAKTNLSKKEIDKTYVGQHPIFLLEKATPGLYAYSESGTGMANYGQMRLRGINQERINFTLNGVPLNDMIDQGVFFSNFTDLSSNFESIQVQRGVGTSSNGVSSYGGSINFESLNLQNKSSFTRLDAGIGSFGTYRANAQHFTGIGKSGLGMMVGLSGLTSDGYRDNTFTDAVSLFSSGGYFGDESLIKYTFFVSRSQNGLGYQTIEESLLDTNRTINLLNPNDTDDVVQFLGQLQSNFILNENWTLGATLYYGGAHVKDFLFSYPIGTDTLAAIDFPLRNDHIGGIFNASYTGDRLNMTAGMHGYAFFRTNKEQNVLPVSEPAYYIETSRKSELSAFVKADYAVGKLTFYGDVQMRATQLSISPDYAFLMAADSGDFKFDWVFLNPKVGLTYDVSPDLSLFSSWGRSSREPTRIDYLADFKIGTDNYPRLRNGGGFTEEHVNDFELGMRWVRPQLNVEVNYYHMRFKNEIAPFGPVIEFGLPQRVNIPKSVRQGVELAWAFQIVPELMLSGNWAYLHTEVKALTLDGADLSGKKQILSPAWIKNASLTFQPMESLGMTVSSRLIGEQYMEITNDEALKVPFSGVIDFQVSAKVTPKLTVRAFVNNLLDSEYYTFGLPSDADFSGTVERGFFVQPGRNYYLSVNFQF